MPTLKPLAPPPNVDSVGFKDWLFLFYKRVTDAAFDALTATSVLVTGSLGYSAGAGGTVSQGTSKSTGVTLDKICGAITMNAAALGAGVEATFTVTDSQVAATDVVVVCVKSGGTAGAYAVWVSAVGAGSFAITVSNVTAGSLSESPVINFAIFKAVAA